MLTVFNKMEQQFEDHEEIPLYMLHNKFVRGLREKYNMDPEDLNDYWYMGGTGTESALKYFILSRKNPIIQKLELPPHADTCICDTKIVHNYYITDGKQILVIGSKCREQFCNENCNTRTCAKCRAPHINRKVNLCNDCRKVICHECYKPLHIYITTCPNSKHEPVPGKCAMCGIACPLDKDLCLQCSGYKYTCLDCGKYANWEFCDDCIVAMGFFDP